MKKGQHSKAHLELDGWFLFYIIFNPQCSLLVKMPQSWFNELTQPLILHTF